jgi:hypothetical protein
MAVSAQTGQSQKANDRNWYALSPAEVTSELGSRPRQGLLSWRG